MARLTIRRSSVLISVAALLAVIGSGYAEATAYETVRSAPRFAIGGVGVAGVTSSEELAMRKLRDNQRGDEQLRKLLREATPAGQMVCTFRVATEQRPRLRRAFRAVPPQLWRHHSSGWLHHSSRSYFADCGVDRQMGGQGQVLGEKDLTSR